MIIIAWILAFVIAITIHEAAHAFAADRLGDPTPRLMGRLTLNPIAHYDPVGTTLLLFLILMNSLGFNVIPFGWAKPVIFDPYNLEKPRRDSAIISLAGPAANLLVCLLFSLLLHLSPSQFLTNLLLPAIILNTSLAFFNLLPIHPLDGGKILVGILPEENAREVDFFLQRYGLIILLFLIFPTINGASFISVFLSPILNFSLKILLP